MKSNVFSQVRSKKNRLSVGRKNYAAIVSLRTVLKTFTVTQCATYVYKLSWSSHFSRTQSRIFFNTDYKICFICHSTLQMSNSNVCL